MHPPYINAPQPYYVPHDHPSPFDDMISRWYADSDNKLWNDVSRAPFPSSDLRRQCSHFLKRLRIHKRLFLHTYVHLVSCSHGSDLQLLVERASQWIGWGSVLQLIHHPAIRHELVTLGNRYPCHLHRSLLAPHIVINDDESDLLCHLLYCRRKSELYELPNRTESEQVIELLWQFLAKHPNTEILRRLRAQIYRMARKSAHLPRDLYIKRPSIRNEQVLGVGAFGLVSRAVMDGQGIAIKKILCKDGDNQRRCLEMFASEAILWKTLNHKNIVPFLGVITEGTFNICLVSPFYANGNIKTYMNKFDPRGWVALARTLARDLAEGLEYIHNHEPPIIHGDLKGDNVLVDDSGHARLGDFGQSHASDSGRYLDSTRVGLAYNPVHWMAPEIFEGGDRVKATDKSDIYSFGCVLYEMVSGQIPFGNYPHGDVYRRVRAGERPERPRSISEDEPLWRTAKRCWASDPMDRPSAASLVSRLR